MKKLLILGVLATIFLIPVNTSLVYASEHVHSCGYDDPNPDSFEVDELCEDLDYEEGCFTKNGELVDRCAKKLEEKGSQEYEEYKKHQHSDKEYEEKSGELAMHVTFPKPAEYYGDIQFNVNGNKDTFDAYHWIEEKGQSMTFPYTYYGYKPDKTKACLVNLESLNEVCKTIDSSVKVIYFTMPD